MAQIQGNEKKVDSKKIIFHDKIMRSRHDPFQSVKVVRKQD